MYCSDALTALTSVEFFDTVLLELLLHQTHFPLTSLQSFLTTCIHCDDGLSQLEAGLHVQFCFVVVEVLLPVC